MPWVHSIAPLFLCVSASSVLPGGGGGGNADVVASVALVWASQDKEKVSVPSLVSCQALQPGISLSRSLHRGVEMSFSNVWMGKLRLSLGTRVRTETG